MASNPLSAWRDFCDLPGSTDAQGSGLPCGKNNRHLLVKGSEGEPILFLNSTARVNPRAPIRLKNVIGEFDRQYAFRVDSGIESSGCFTTLRCLPGVAHLHSFFVEMAVATANTQPELLSEEEVDSFVEGLVSVFRQGKLPGQSTVVGLWGELAVLTMADDIDAWIGAWHDTTTEAFDFCFKDKRIEVKSTEKPLREHEFSASQVLEARIGDFIASVQLKRSAAGYTAVELANQIASKLSESSRAKFWSLLYATLGEDAIFMDATRFDLDGAQKSLVFIPVARIPTVVVPEKDSSLISCVRYRANVEAVAKEHGIKRVNNL